MSREVSIFDAMITRPDTTGASRNNLHYSTRAVINLDAFRSNLDTVRRCVGPDIKIMAVLKSNAYGHGVYHIAREAVRWGVDYLAVARYTEAIELRERGINKAILVCEIVHDTHITGCLENDIDLTVTTLEGANAIAGTARQLGKRARVHVKVDTGMGRLGFPHANAAREIETIAHTPGLDLIGVFSHFATSEEEDRSFAREQIRRFSEALNALEQAGIKVPLRHMANSGAILNFPEAHFDMVRPGIVLYGYAPSRKMQSEVALQPVMSLLSRVSHVKVVSPGESISYGRRYIAKAQTRIATIPIGYGDGYSRSLTNNADVLIGGKRFHVVGTVCMDHVMVDLGEDNSVKLNDEVVLIGGQGREAVSCWEIADRMGTIPYEVTCLITPRVQRLFVHGNSHDWENDADSPSGLGTSG